MDESLVDIVLILLAALVAISVVPTFEVELPVSVEVQDSDIQLKPLQIAITASGGLMYADGTTDNAVRSLSYQELYDLIAATHPNRTVELTADEAAPAALLLGVNQLVQEVGRNAVFMVLVDDGS